MMIKIKVIGLLTLFAFSSCSAQKKTIAEKKIPNGKWVLVQDSLSSIVVNEKFVYGYYENKAIDTTTYIIAKQPCDTSYKSPNKEALFLSWYNGLCSEIVGITNEYIELIYTANGKTLTYRREK